MDSKKLPTIEILNRSTDKPYGVTRYLFRFPAGYNIECSIMDIETSGLPQKTVDYILSTLILGNK